MHFAYIIRIGVHNAEQAQYCQSIITKLHSAALSWCISVDNSFSYISACAIWRFCRSITLGSTVPSDGVLVPGIPSRSFRLTYRLSTRMDDGRSGFADPDLGNCSSHSSTSGKLCLYNRSQILWHSNMQETMAFSMAERSATQLRQRQQRRFCKWRSGILKSVWENVGLNDIFYFSIFF